LTRVNYIGLTRVGRQAVNERGRSAYHRGMNAPKTPREHREELLDEALEESFPASDPISPAAGPGEPVGSDASDDGAE
jgi:hypothetical protein